MESLLLPCPFTRTHHQITFDQAPQISRTQVMYKSCAVGARTRRARFCFIPAQPAPGANHKPLQAVLKTTRLTVFHTHRTNPKPSGIPPKNPPAVGPGPLRQPELRIGRWQHFPAEQGPAGNSPRAIPRGKKSHF